MALNQSALIDLLKELEITETTERIRLLTQRAFQELIDAEAETVIGAAPTNAATTVQRNATARGPERSRPLRETSIYVSRNCVRGRSSHHCSNVAAESIKHSSAW